MCISDWSSDVCYSDLIRNRGTRRWHRTVVDGGRGRGLRRCCGLVAIGRHRGGVGGQDFHPAVDAAIGNNQRIGTQCQAHLAQGFAIRAAKETAYVHGVLPPITAVSLKMRSSGISTVDNTPRSEEHTSELQSLM